MDTFNRKELKFVIDRVFCDLLLDVLPDFMPLDPYNKTSPDESLPSRKITPYRIHSIYFDTADHRLAYLSYEKDERYRYKIRLRSYDEDFGVCYLEIKKKFDGLSNKRRISLSYDQAMDFVRSGIIGQTTQKTEEIKNYIGRFERLEPQIYVSYDRIAFTKPDLRITIDENLLSRDFETGQKFAILDPDKYVLEIKSSGSIPLWLAKLLSQNRIFKSSFSKYGNSILKKLSKEAINV
jgi:hypothetical protein